MTSAPAFHPLHHGSIARILWLHRTDRWYFGDFLRHAAWAQWLRATFPQATIDLASHPGYLSIYEDDRFAHLLDATTLQPGSIRSYDLVVQPTAFEPASFDGDLPLLLATWDTGWAIRVHGQPWIRGSKAELNYFRAAHPSAVIGPRSTWHCPLQLRSSEIDAVRQALSRAFPGTGSIVVYNPTASNPFTRDTDLPKEVDNALTAREHAFVLRRLIELLPDHHVIVGSSLKPGDTANAQIVQTVTDLSSPGPISIIDLDLPKAITIRGFTALLDSERVCSVTGAGTGTNTHLASLSHTCSFSIERGADSHMVGNWTQASAFQMGSFRWRNPTLSTGIHTIDWSDKTEAVLAAAAEAFTCHHAIAHDQQTLFADLAGVAEVVARFKESWPADPVTAVRAAHRLLGHLTPPARAHYSRFDDEAAYLRLKLGIQSSGLHAVIAALTTQTAKSQIAVQLFEDSNLHKLITHLTLRGAPVGAIR